VIEINEIVNKILDIRNSLATRKMRDWTGEDLTAAILELSILKMSLGRFIAGIEDEKNQQETHRKKLEAIEYFKNREDKQSTRDSELNARLDTIDELKKELKLESQVKDLRILREDTSTLIDTIRTRISFLKKEMNGLS